MHGEANIFPGAWALDLKGSVPNRLVSPVKRMELVQLIGGWPDHGLSDWEVIGCLLLHSTWQALASLCSGE